MRLGGRVGRRAARSATQWCAEFVFDMAHSADLDRPHLLPARGSGARPSRSSAPRAVRGSAPRDRWPCSSRWARAAAADRAASSRGGRRPSRRSCSATPSASPGRPPRRCSSHRPWSARASALRAAPPRHLDRRCRHGVGGARISFRAGSRPTARLGPTRPLPPVGHATPGCQPKSKLLVRSGMKQSCVGFRRILTDGDRRSDPARAHPRLRQEARAVLGRGNPTRIDLPRHDVAVPREQPVERVTQEPRNPHRA